MRKTLSLCAAAFALALAGPALGQGHGPPSELDSVEENGELAVDGVIRHLEDLADYIEQRFGPQAGNAVQQLRAMSQQLQANPSEANEERAKQMIRAAHARFDPNWTVR
jgi:hypothetical protein